MVLDEMVWKCLLKISEHNKATTFQDVKNSKYEHPLKKCVQCTGYDTMCINYHNMTWYDKVRER